MQYDYRKRVIRSMQDGDVLVLQMSTCCPPLKSKLFHPNKFPSELLNSSLAVVGPAPVPCPLSPVSCLLSRVSYPLSTVSCLLSAAGFSCCTFWCQQHLGHFLAVKVPGTEPSLRT